MSDKHTTVRANKMAQNIRGFYDMPVNKKLDLTKKFERNMDDLEDDSVLNKSAKNERDNTMKMSVVESYLNLLEMDVKDEPETGEENKDMAGTGVIDADEYNDGPGLQKKLKGGKPEVGKED